MERAPCARGPVPHDDILTQSLFVPRADLDRSLVRSSETQIGMGSSELAKYSPVALAAVDTPLLQEDEL